MTHTKGPWIVDDGDGDVWGVFQGEDGGSIAYLVEPSPESPYFVRLRPEEAEANARLIAAAPDTFEGCQLLESLCTWLLHRFGPDSPEGREATFRLERARAAILKAEQGGE